MAGLMIDGRWQWAHARERSVRVGGEDVRVEDVKGNTQSTNGLARPSADWGCTACVVRRSFFFLELRTEDQKRVLVIPKIEISIRISVRRASDRRRASQQAAS